MVKFELRYRGQSFEIPQIDVSRCRLQDAKLLIALLTNVSIQSMKLIGLTKAPMKGNLSEITLLQDAGLKYGKGKSSETVSITVMGEQQSRTTVDEIALEELCCKYTVVSDLECKFTPTSEVWQKLEKHSNSCDIHYINAPRPGKKLLVLDLDHTILDFSKDVSISAAAMKRPHLDDFLSKVYVHYDLCIWSQTRWTWLEVKLHELGMVTHPEYKICFCLDKTTMFRAPNTGEYVKPLAIIWTKCADFRWNSRNTLHVDDLRRNFELNPKNGILIEPFYRNETDEDDDELLHLSNYLLSISLAPDVLDFDHSCWRSFTLDNLTSKVEEKE
eukprot:GSChrysophyteH1.ASY1.ANO1.1461.1 assembled CDS